jgi:lysyl-tRNA synthetase class 2
MSFAENWQPSASIAHLRQRQTLIAKIRGFFTAREYLEVETPIMARFGITDVYLSNIQATFRGQSYCLQTSPEYHMKRLLAAGSGSIFQLARVFRDDELGRWHNPEFTLLEWYRLDATHHDLMDEMDVFLQDLLASSPMIRKTYQQVFIEACHLDPLTCQLDDLNACLAQHDLLNILPIDETCPDQYLFLLMSHVVEPFLSKLPAPVAVFDFPASQASLAKLNGAVAERFEVYYRGVELANGFHELTEAALQRERFSKDNQIRKTRGLPQNPPDEYLLEALQSGLPPCSGVALGIDRLLAIALNQSTIASVISFDVSRS